MVDGMGGPNSNHYQRFKILCFTAYTTLRKNANLILNLISLMINANIPDIQIEPDKAVLKVQEKFRLDLSEEDAIKHFETLLNETSYLSAVFDQIHNIAVSDFILNIIFICRYIRETTSEESCVCFSCVCTICS